MQTLITGAAGFIGRHLTEDLLKKGNTVRAIDIAPSALNRLKDHPNLEIVAADIRDVEKMRHAVRGIDIVFHLASAHLSLTASEQEYRNINVDATLSLAALCHAAGIRRFVHCSSVGIYGAIDNPPANEESPRRPDLVYERTKLVGEQSLMEFCRSSGLPFTVLRPVWVYGPGCARTAKLFSAIRKGRFVMAGSGRAFRHCLYISDLITAFNLCAVRDEAAGQDFIIGDLEAITVQQLVSEISKILHVTPPRLRLPISILFPACACIEMLFRARKKEPPLSRRSLKFFTNNTYFDVSKARKLLQFTPEVELGKGLRQTYAYLLQNGQIMP